VHRESILETYEDIYIEIIVKSNVVFDCERRLGKYLKKISQKHEPMLLFKN